MAKLPYGFLFNLTKISQNSFFNPIHNLARFVYLGPLTFFVEKKLCASTNTMLLKVIPRHSVKSGANFNLFLSDIDFYVVSPSSITLNWADQVSQYYSELKVWFPMLGELEIFTQGEWLELQRVKEENGPLLEILRDLKKIRWMVLEIQKNKTEYHLYKAKRAIRNILIKYKQDIPKMELLRETKNHQIIADGISASLKKIIPVDKICAQINFPLPEIFSFYSRELDLTIGYGDFSDADLILDRNSILCLLGLFPTHANDDPSLHLMRQELRNTPELGPHHLAVLKHEFLYANAAPRIHLKWREDSWRWALSLKEQLESRNVLLPIKLEPNWPFPSP